MEKDSNTAPSLFFSHFFLLFFPFFMGSFWPLFFLFFISTLGQCTNNDDHHTSIYLQLKRKLQLETRTKNMTLYECLWQCTRMCNDTSVTSIKNDERWLSHKYYVSYMIMQTNMTMTMCVIKMERWKLHGNISRNGYGNAMIGRYGGG